MIKALKICGKVISIILGTIIGFLALCCIITLIWGGVQMSRGTVTDTLPITPDDFTPAIRLVVYTDTHNENENLADAINTAYKLFDNDTVYKGVDAFYGLGDFTSIGSDEDYANYVNILKENVREETVCINVCGNHEFKQDDYKEKFEKHFQHGLNTVTEINGFTCISFSGEKFLTEWTFTPSSVKWLSNEIHKAEATADNKPIFVFQHPHPFGTVYGSSFWCSPQINPAFAGHSKVINFSGHSHFPMNDPRSINQSTYTSVGVGAMARFETDKNYIVGQHPERYEDAAQFCVVEADNDGRVRIRGYDLLSDTFFCDYFIENVNDADTFAYTYKNMKAHDNTPVFKENATAAASVDENGNYRITFSEPEVAEGYIVHTYYVKITDDNGKEVYKTDFVAPYYIVDNEKTDGFTVGKDVLEKGKNYTLEVTAESAYKNKSETVKMTFTV